MQSCLQNSLLTLISSYINKCDHFPDIPGRKKHSRDHINHIHIPVFRIYHISAISRTSENRQHILDHTQNTDQQKSIGSTHHKTKQFIQSLYNRKPCQDPQGKNNRF